MSGYASDGGKMGLSRVRYGLRIWLPKAATLPSYWVYSVTGDKVSIDAMGVPKFLALALGDGLLVYGRYYVPFSQFQLVEIVSITLEEQTCNSTTKLG